MQLKVNVVWAFSRHSNRRAATWYNSDSATLLLLCMLRTGFRQAVTAQQLCFVRQRVAVSVAPFIAEVKLWMRTIGVSGCSIALLQPFNRHMQATCCSVAATLPSGLTSSFAAQQLPGNIQHRAFSSKDTPTTPLDVEAEAPEDAGNQEAAQESAEAVHNSIVQEKDMEVRWCVCAHVCYSLLHASHPHLSLSADC